MEYIKLLIGLALLALFSLLFYKHSKRSGFMHALFRIDTVLGLAAGLYLVITSVDMIFSP